MKVLHTEYADALKTALIARRDGTIDSGMDAQLGLFLANVTRWAIASQVKAGKLWRTVSQDEDFQADVLCHLCGKIDQLDLDRTAKEIIVYLKKTAQNKCANYVRDMSRQKRQHEDVELIECDLATDLFGNRIN